MRRTFILSTLLSLVGSLTLCFAQSSTIQQEIQRGISLYNYSHPMDARQELMRVKEKLQGAESKFDLERVEYYIALCDTELKLRESEARLKRYLSEYRGAAYSNDVQFALGVHYCISEDMTAAEEAFAEVNYKSLDTRSRDKYDLRMGYMAFMAGDFDKAEPHFKKILDKSIYADHATYYLSYISYARGDVATARKGFESLSRSAQYGDLMPYYLLQLDFREAKYDKVVSQGDALIEQTISDYAVEIRRIMSESYFQLGNYQQAVRYMNEYKSSGGEMGRVENYILGYSLYRQTIYSDAILYLREACGADDMLTQNASYHLADCYLKADDKHNALNSFAMAAGSNFDEAIAEDALFNYAKLQYELDDGLFNKTINVLSRYVEQYPSSERLHEAKSLLVAAYYNSHNYDEAYDAISRITNPDTDILIALQKITYFKGLEAYNDGDLDKAESSFAESRRVGLDAKYNALNLFWLGEIAYARGNMDEALHNYRQYVALAPRTEREYAMAQYNMGYCHFNSGKYSLAEGAFDKFLSLYQTNDDYRLNALNRRGDAAYADRAFDEAVDFYNQVISSSSVERYYAEYQRAITLGAQNKTNAKIAALDAIVRADKGDFVVDAHYELGRTYISSEQYSRGVETLESFVERYPYAEKNPQALSDLGLAYTNLGNTERALHYYDRVVKSAPQSSQSKGAMEGIREIYISDGNADAYFDYAESVGLEGDLSAIARDSMSYASAQKLYLDNKLESAANSFESYLRKYPDGHYVNEALYFLSDCHIKNEHNSKAIESLTKLSERGQTQYTERVLENLSYLCYQAERYQEAAKAYRSLYDHTKDTTKRRNAASGYISSVLNYADGEAILAMADDMEQMSDVTDVARRKARYAKAEVLTLAGKHSQALEVYELLALEVKSAEGAEARYRIIEAKFNDEKHDEAEKMILELAASKTPQNYWLAKSFLILGDIYFAKGDTFQARSTYQSVVDGYSPADDGIVDEAKQRIAKLN